jgi:long-chain acyl-CoA synthetase
MDPRIWLQHYDQDVPPDITVREVTLPGLLRESAAQYSSQPALIFLNATVTYREFQDAVHRLATALAKLGVEKGTRVAIQMPNMPQSVIAYYATLSLGAVAVPTNPLYTTREIEHQWTDAGCAVAVVADFIYESRIKQVRKLLQVEHYIIASIPDYLRFPLNLLAPLKLKRSKPPLMATVEPGPGIHFFRELIAESVPNPPAVHIDLDEVATLLYTGGTTGVSKGAMLTHRNLSVNVQQLIAWTPSLVDPGHEVMLTALPLFHSYGLTVAMNLGIAVGASLVLLPNPRDIPAVVKSITKHRVTMAPAVPAMYNAINQYPGIEKLDLRSVKVCNSGSAPLPVEVLQRFEELTGGKITEGFGLTETSPVTHSNPLLGTRKVGSIGVPLPGTDAKIVDIENGTREMPPGTQGELILRGPQVMPGYWNNREETEKTIRDGWLFTGDLSVMDEDGFFFIVGRKKDMILCSGYNVFPDEVDRVLMAHPGILEAATIGLPDEKRGETVKSFVVLAPGEHLTGEEIITYCRENLAAYKVPRAIEFRGDLPKSSVLKILRRELKEQELAKAGTKEKSAGARMRSEA